MPLLLAFALICAPSQGGPQARTCADKGEFLLQGLRHSRDQLRSGEFRMIGTIRSTHPRVGTTIDEETIHSAFDFDSQLLRFDRTGTGREVSPEGKVRAKTVSTKHAFANDRYMNWFSDAPDRVNVSPKREAAGLPFDVRNIGIASQGELVARPFEKLLHALVRNPVQKVEAEDRGVQRLTWVTQAVSGRGKWKCKRTLWIDEQRGFTPLRLEIALSPNAGAEDKWPEPLETTEASWTQVSGVWVPKTFAFSSSARSGAYEFVWESVNAKLPPSLFAPEGFDLPHGAMVLDTSGPKPLVIGYVGEGMAPGQPIGRTRLSMRLALIAVNIALVLFVIGAYVYHRRRSRHTREAKG